MTVVSFPDLVAPVSEEFEVDERHASSILDELLLDEFWLDAEQSEWENQ